MAAAAVVALHLVLYSEVGIILDPTKGWLLMGKTQQMLAKCIKMPIFDHFSDFPMLHLSFPHAPCMVHLPYIYDKCR